MKEKKRDRNINKLMNKESKRYYYRERETDKFDPQG
jgi:hypothetical protein